MLRLAFIVLCGLLHTGIAGAQDLGIPAELKAWESWVMHGEEYRGCPMHQGAAAADASSFVCVWPGRLRVSVSSAGGEFQQRWQVYAESWVALPGDDANWPEAVQVDGKPASVVPRDAVPSLRLSRGEYSISGKFTWSRRPESLRIPRATALVDLQLDGKSIAPVELRNDRLWLGAVRTVTVPRAVQVQVYRLVQDGIPLQLTTQVHIKVSGDAREELLARVLPEGFVPIAAHSVLPVRFEPDGKLRVQVRSGEHVITIEARALQAADSIVLSEAEGLWSSDEIWSYRSDDRLRVTAIEGATTIDPVQAGVPIEWRELPAYRLLPGAGITIAQRTRGLNNVDANRLMLRRDLWLDFNHDGFIAADQISGSMQQGWRLDMLSPYRLLNARREDENLLITDGSAGRTGIELRTPGVNVTTLSRTESTGVQPATGWDTRFEQTQATLHLPPGHRLLAAFGVDDAPDAWLSQWRLLDLFLLLLVTAAAFRLLGIGAAVVAALAIVLTYHEANAPSWLWINLLIAVALARAIPEGRLRMWVNGYRALSLAALVIVLVPFAVTQYRLAIHPQLAATDSVAANTYMALDARLPEEVAASSPAPQMEVPQDMNERARRDVAQAIAGKSSDNAPVRLERYAPDTKLQTGPGIPAWNYLSYRLHWSGPVDAQQTMRLAILSPLLLSVWRLAGLILSALLLIALVRLAYGSPQQWRWLPTRTAASSGVLFFFLMCGGHERATAATPDPSLLTQLKQRLSQPAKCVPNCANVVLATVSVSGDRLEVQMEVHAQASVAIGMPQAGPQWAIERVLVDERPMDALARDEAHRLQLPLTPGVHQVSVIGKVVQADELTLEFSQPPHRIQVRADGWDATGSSEGRLLNNALQLTRRAGATAIQPTTAPQRFAPFVRVHRRLYMNLDWTVTTRVERLAPQEGAFTVRLPLLPGESVLTPGLEVRDGAVLVSLAAGAQDTVWESSLPQVDKLQWVAAANTAWVEHWEIIVSPMWHTDFSGTPTILPDADAAGAWVNRFLPRPGESLEATVSRPAASAGTTLAVDNANVSTEFGQRLSTTTLGFTYRSSQGGRHDLRVPEDARVESVTVDGQSIAVRPDKGMLPLTLIPGQHQVVVRFSRDAGVGMISRPPPIDLGAEASNVRTTLALADNRWVLFTWGAGIGPTILYWGELVAFAVIAVLLGRLRRTPLRTRDWLFLGLGLSTFSWWVLLVFGAWLFVLDSRSRWTIESRRGFNVVQVALIVLTVVALGTLVSAIPFGLLGQPDMGIRSADMYGGGLAWFMDRTASQLPQPAAISVSIWFYKLAMLIWALWLSFALLRWLPWAWRQYSIEGLWRGKDVKSPSADGSAATGGIA